MLTQRAAAHRPVDPPEEHPDRSMQILQYATAATAMAAALLLTILR
jgi:hypothetical protein